MSRGQSSYGSDINSNQQPQQPSASGKFSNEKVKISKRQTQGVEESSFDSNSGSGVYTGPTDGLSLPSSTARYKN